MALVRCPICRTEDGKTKMPLPGVEEKDVALHLVMIIKRDGGIHTHGDFKRKTFVEEAVRELLKQSGIDEFVYVKNIK